MNFDFKRPLDRQLAELKDALRANPQDSALRVFYFQVLAVHGEWQKALDQLQICAQLDRKAETMARAYREVILCEVARRDVFAGERTPNILGQPPEWLGWLLEALQCLAKGRTEQAADLRNAAFEQAPASAGEIDGEPFDWIADSDARIGPVCELYANGSYYWVPFESISQISFEKPQDLRDLVWSACEVTLLNGGVMHGFIPTRYPGSEAVDRDEIRLSRASEWRDLGDDQAFGLGQRVWVTDRADAALLDVRRVKFAE
ncbi:type VI secretion system accessory protein TagJ [Acidovorax sp. NCPPB 4044]|uniref:type VI secretion system accessory protein TagJ n=2 Tax=unclassified Acidovorax TaxID=2684926 RepID=UPI00230206CE|nr:type VI secretion system accessory protein TagJ [Acidovorax sp. NCPPB 4044]MDA8520007.1 virulence protein SciE type [Acidovorax sp. NCPPB 4044]